MPHHARQFKRWWRTRQDPFAAVWPEIREMIESDLAREATSIFQDLQHRFPDQFTSGQLRTFQRKVSDWRRETCANARYELWTLRLLQGKIDEDEFRSLFGSKVSQQDVSLLLDCIRYKSIRYRNRAVAVLAKLNGVPIPIISKILQAEHRTVRGYIQKFAEVGASRLADFSRDIVKKANCQDYKDALFSILHEPPSLYGINRTRWEMEDLQHVMAQKGFPISLANIRQIIRNAGYKFRKARKVLTSTDPQYREKLAEVTRILSGLTDSQRFFSIDEFGPFAVKTQGGRALTPPDQQRIVPQRQKSKGRLTLIGALELSTNQITYFYADRKSTAEMIELMHLLLIEYRDQSLLYLSWDAASWHASKAFFEEVALVNGEEYRSAHQTPSVVLAPLPACGQFLNVIESVFSGMAKAIIHNSDYGSVDHCKDAIDRYFKERNQFFIEHPKRAGNKIWGKELVPSVFSESNNCKDPHYR
jgi:transposase